MICEQGNSKIVIISMISPSINMDTEPAGNNSNILLSTVSPQTITEIEPACNSSNMLLSTFSPQTITEIESGNNNILLSTVSAPSDMGKEPEADNSINNDESTISPSGPRVKKSRRQKFCEAWLGHPDFMGWLEKCDDDRLKARCKVCKKTLVAGKSELARHKDTTRHVINMNKRREVIGTEKVSTEEAGTEEVPISVDMELRARQAQLRFCLGIVEHNKSFNSHHFTALPKDLPESNVLKPMTLKRTKIAAIIKNVIDKTIVKKIIETLQDKYYSVLIDENTDATGTKILCILIRYIHAGKVETCLLDLIRIKECTGENLYKCFVYSLQKFNLSVEKIVGVCLDNASVMLSRENSLISRLLQVNTEIAIFPCISQSMHLVACRACEYLPAYVEQFLHSIYNYFSKSPKRQSLLGETELFPAQTETNKISQDSATRWLALSECVKKILAQWTMLFDIFTSIKEKSRNAKGIFDRFNCLFTKAYLQFLNYILNRFANINSLFQCSTIVIHCLLPECTRFLKLLCVHFVKKCYLEAQDFYMLDVKNKTNLLPLQSIVIGDEAQQTINEVRNSKENSGKIVEFYRNIQKFYQSAFQEIVKRIPFGDPFFQSLEFLSPHVALDISKHTNQMQYILDKYPSKFNRSNIMDEWYTLPHYFTEQEGETLLQLDVQQFWHKIREVKDFKDASIFENISEVAFVCLSLPYSNADAETYFSTVTQIKTKLRNRLTVDMICSLTRIQLDLKNKNKNCYTYEISDEMLELFNSNMYKKDIVPQELLGILIPGMEESESVQMQQDDN